MLIHDCSVGSSDHVHRGNTHFMTCARPFLHIPATSVAVLEKLVAFWRVTKYGGFSQNYLASLGFKVIKHQLINNH